MKTTKTITLKNLTRYNVWDIQENDLLRMFETAEKDAEAKDNIRYYIDLAKTAFIIEELPIDKDVIRKKYENLGYTVANVRNDETESLLIAIKKRPISRVSDLTYENIKHITAAHLIEVLDRNFGGGWDSLSQSVKDIIESGFDISTTTLPKDRLHKKGGTYEKKVADGYEVLEVSKGSWVEAIFAKLKPEAEKPRISMATASSDDEEEIPEDTFNKRDDDDDDIQEPTEFGDDDDMTEDNYRTTFAMSDDDDDEADGMQEFDPED